MSMTAPHSRRELAPTHAMPQHDDHIVRVVFLLDRTGQAMRQVPSVRLSFQRWTTDGLPIDPVRHQPALGTRCVSKNRVDATIATPLHPLLLQAAEQAVARSAAASGKDPNEELKEACVAILTAAIAVETGTHWAAHTQVPLRPVDRRGGDSGSIEFGDGRTGARPSTAGANAQARYRPGGGQAGHAASSALETLLELVAQEADEADDDVDRLYVDAYIETGEEWIAVADAADLRRAIAERADVCFCIRWGSADPRDDPSAPPLDGSASATGRERDTGQTRTA